MSEREDVRAERKRERERAGCERQRSERSVLETSKRAEGNHLLLQQQVISHFAFKRSIAGQAKANSLFHSFLSPLTRSLARSLRRLSLRSMRRQACERMMLKSFFPSLFFPSFHLLIKAEAMVLSLSLSHSQCTHIVSLTACAATASTSCPSHP